MPEEEYLGDGLYASFDGEQFRLRAPRTDGDHVVFLDPTTYSALLTYVNKKVREIHERPNQNQQ